MENIIEIFYQSLLNIRLLNVKVVRYTVYNYIDHYYIIKLVA